MARAAGPGARAVSTESWITVLDHPFPVLSVTPYIHGEPGLVLHRLVFCFVKTPARLFAVFLVMLIVVGAPAAPLAVSDGVVLATEEPADETPADEPMFEEGWVAPSAYFSALPRRFAMI